MKHQRVYLPFIVLSRFPALLFYLLRASSPVITNGGFPALLSHNKHDQKFPRSSSSKILNPLQEMKFAGRP